MAFTRRTFLERTGLTLFPATLAFQESQRVPKLVDPAKLSMFVDPLPIPPIARVAANRYRIAMREISARVHRDLPPTTFWTYGDSLPGPTFETRNGEALSIEWVNTLPPRHFLPVDHRLCGAEKRKTGGEDGGACTRRECPARS